MRRGFLTRALRTAFFAKDAAAVDRLLAEVRALPRTKYSEIDLSFCEAIAQLEHGHPAEAERIVHEQQPRLEQLIQGERLPASFKPHFPATNYLMAWSLEAQGKLDEAAEYWKKNVNPPTPFRNFEERRAIYEARARLAVYLARKGDLDGAEKLIAENRKWNANWAPTREQETTVAELRRQKVLAAAR
jgi:tetratricopeptide (TPR) repeat protein